jgi:hypothetical protein
MQMVGQQKTIKQKVVVGKLLNNIALNNNLITYKSPNKNGDFLFIPIC